MSPPIGVADYYAGKSIFITGATGFMGIVLVEKLLRSCPDVKTLYLLMRTKKGLSVQERLQKYINDEVFDRIKAENPKNLQKLRVVPGDVVDDNLGMTIADRVELQRECQIIFHVAASVRFDMFIRDAVEINVFGTKKVLELAESMKNLEVFLHMSTAYCHDYLDVLEEKLYPAMHSPQDVMRIVKWMNDDILKAIEKKLIHPLPNTYTYTKNISEGLVAQYARKFKIAIARPSIVTGAVQEPFPGWINAMSGPTGLLVAGYKGVFRVMHTKKDMQPDVIAVDMAVNASILLAYTTVVEQHEEIQVSNITNSGVNTKSWVDFAAVGWQVMRKYPSSICIWYPDISSTESRALYQVSAIFMHWIPALLIDMLLAIFRQKTFMIRIQKRLHHGLELLNHYMNGEWLFKNDNFRSFRNRIPAAERKVFYTEYEKIDLDQYMVNYLRGIRQYCCRESWDSLPKARRQQKFLYGLRITVRLILLWWFLKMVYSYVA